MKRGLWQLVITAVIAGIVSSVMRHVAFALGADPSQMFVAGWTGGVLTMVLAIAIPDRVL